MRDARPSPEQAACRRGSGLIALLVALIVLQLLVAVIVTGGARDQASSGVRVEASRALYAAEGAANMAYAEVFAGADLDGDAGLGTISNDGNAANDPSIGGVGAWVAPVGVTQTYSATARGAWTSRRVQFSVTTGAPAESFELYDPAVALNGTDGWEPWDSNPGAVAYATRQYHRSGVQALDILQTTDLVYRYSATSGVWKYSAWQYIPSSTTGTDHYFILMNTYTSQGAKSWSTQVRFELGTNKLYDNVTGANTASLNIIRDQWVRIEVDIDLDAGTQTVRYGGNLLFTGGWNRLGGVRAIAAVDLYGSTASHVYYDDVQLTGAAGSYTKVTGIRAAKPSP